MNVKYTDIKHFTIFNAIAICTATAFYTFVQNEFPTDTTKLTLQLTTVCNLNKEHHRLINNLASRIGVKNKDGSGNCVSMSTGMEIIPRKNNKNPATDAYMCQNLCRVQ